MERQTARGRHRLSGPAVQVTLDQVETPALILDLDVVERNVAALERLLEGRKATARPHSKTHKTPRIGLMQTAHGAVGICCSKISEAEVMVAGGIRDVLITTEIVGPAKVGRLIGLCRQANITVVVDDLEVARSLSDAALGSGVTIACLLDIDVGQSRTGVPPDQSALSMAIALEKLKGLNLRGIQGYEGHIQMIKGAAERRKAHAAAMALLDEAVSLFVRNGLSVDTVSTAGTGTFQFAADYDFVTEVQPGSYVAMDASYSRVEGVPFEQALTVLTAVISRSSGWAVVDAGMKSLTTEYGNPVPLNISATYSSEGDEHGKLEFEAEPSVSIGELVRIVPSHCDTTINLYDWFVLTRGSDVVGSMPIAGRGRVQ
jgi:3-hydroxy-D-aspartate aldolase